ncbi:MAG: hypothetical protein J5852_02435 [Clostridia bacterium]|nr:hypothetical protein [Clostridia bacterium]
MKKVICIVLALSLFMFAAACKEKKEEVKHDVDVSYFADMGTMKGSDLKIGDSVPEEKDDDDTYFFTKAGAKSYFSNGDFCYYYDEDKKDPKIYAIAAFSDCMGFETGAISIEVTDVLDSQNVEYTSRTPKKDEVFFLPAADNREIIECKGFKHNLIFVFENNALCAAYLGD